MDLHENELMIYKLLIEEFGTEEHGWDKKPMMCVDPYELAKFVNRYREDAIMWEQAYFKLKKETSC